MNVLYLSLNKIYMGAFYKRSVPFMVLIIYKERIN